MSSQGKYSCCLVQQVIISLMCKCSLFQYCDIANMLMFLLLLPTVPVLEFEPDWLQCMQIFLHKCV